jgi:hypothetical protein
VILPQNKLIQTTSMFEPSFQRLLPWSLTSQAMTSLIVKCTVGAKYPRPASITKRKRASTGFELLAGEVLPRRDAQASGTLVTETQNPFAVRNDNDVDLWIGAIPQERRDRVTQRIRNK